MSFLCLFFSPSPLTLSYVLLFLHIKAFSISLFSSVFYAGFEDFFGVPSHAYNEGMTLPPLEKKVKKKKESSLNNFDTRIIDRYHKI